MSSAVNVVLDIDSLDRQLGGIGRYTLELARRLPYQAELGSVRFYGRGQLIDDPARLLSGDPVASAGGVIGRVKRWRTRQVLSSALVHGPNYFLPSDVEVGVVTIHDLSVFKHSESHPAARIAQFERSFASSLARASHVITDTETIRRELIESFAVPAERITAIALGVSERFKPLAERNIALRLHKLGLEPKRYGLCVSTFEPRKKVPELISAWRDLPRQLRNSYPLALAGCDGWLNDAISTKLDEAVGEGWLINLGHVDEDDLPFVYAGAALFVYPSIYEGFGLPPLEAMASGVPTVVSNRSCLPEVCGCAAHYIDPDDRDDLLQGLIKGLEDEQWRLAAVPRGLERARRFTWERCIEDTVSIYRSAFGSQQAKLK